MSYAQQHQVFLCQLGSGGFQVRASLIQNISEDQMLAITEVAAAIAKRRIYIMERDRSEFRAKELFLKQLGSKRIQFARKKVILQAYKKRAIISRFLRRCYIRRAIGYVLRAGEL